MPSCSFWKSVSRGSLTRGGDGGGDGGSESFDCLEKLRVSGGGQKHTSERPHLWTRDGADARRTSSELLLLLFFMTRLLFFASKDPHDCSCNRCSDKGRQKAEVVDPIGINAPGSGSVAEPFSATHRNSRIMSDASTAKGEQSMGDRRVLSPSSKPL